MTTRAPHLSPDPTRRRRSTVWKGLGALLALTVLVAGPPLALLALVGNPLPHQALVGGQLTDTAVIGVLTAIVWAAWAQLMLVVTVEAIAAVRGGALPRRIPWCGFQQHFARRLVVTASLLIAGTSSLMATAAGPAAAAVVQTSLASCVVAPAQVSAPAMAAIPAVDVPPVQGVFLEPVGSVVPIMGDAGTVEASAVRALWYVVMPPHGHRHDSLWDIADRHLGDGMRWREIYELNRDRPQPDGHQLELAKLIQPGWRLLMPPDAVGIATHVELDRPPFESAAPKSARTPTKSAPGVTLIPHPREATPRAPAAPAPAPAAEVRATSHLRTGHAPAEALGFAHEQTDDDAGVPFGALTMGLGVIACAGLTAELARRRRRAQRHRQPGERIRVPKTEATSAERILRVANAEMSADALRDALRTLAATCHREGRPLPVLHAIRLNASEATLLLGTEDREAVAPFVASGPCSWTLEPGVPPTPGEGDAAGPDADAVDPYPALVAIGVYEESILLINLEAAGTLNLVGDAEDTVPIMNALVAELGTSILASSAQVVLTGCRPELASILDAGRVTVLGSSDAEAWARARHRDVAAILAGAGVPDLSVARASLVAADVWPPAVLIRIVGSSDAGGHTLAAVPHSGLCVVTAGATSPGEGWVLRAAGGRWTLEPMGLDVEPQRLDPAELPALVDLLDTTLVSAPRATSEGAPVSQAPSEDNESSVSDACAAAAQRLEPAAPSVLCVAEAIPAQLRSDRGLAPSAASEIQAPRVLVLGPVEVVGVPVDGAPGRRRRATELVAYLALHPGATQYQLDEALWPGARVSRNTRNPLVSRTRQWLGADPHGQPHLGLVGEGGQYTLASVVSCDWRDFCALAERGLTAGHAGTADLIAALELVRGRPFLGVNPATYAWAESEIQDMISAVVDVAHALAELSLAGGDPRRARWATAKGLAAEPFAELLYQDGIRAATALGDDEDVRRMVAALRRQIAALDPDDDVGEAIASLVEAATNG